MKKHKIFCSYAFTGEDKLKVEARMRRVVDLLEGCGHEVYCNLFDSATECYGNPRQFLRRAIDQMNECDKILGGRKPGIVKASWILLLLL